MDARIADFISAETAHANTVRSGGKNASAEAQKASKDAIASRATALGITKDKAGVNLMSKEGHLQLSVTREEVADARSLQAGTPLTHAKDWTPAPGKEGKAVKAGDAREPSATAKFLSENSGALVNIETKKEGLDAINFRQPRHAVAYMDPAKISADLETMRAVTDHTRGTTCSINIAKREINKKAEKGNEGASR